MPQRSQDTSPNAPKLVILGAKLAITAPPWPKTWLHVRSSWALVVHLGPSWLHLGAHLGTTCSPKCSQYTQDAAKTSKSTLQTLIFNDFGINFEAIFKIIFVCYRLCYSHLFLYLFILVFFLSFSCYVSSVFCERSAQASEASVAREAIQTHAQF